MNKYIKNLLVAVLALGLFAAPAQAAFTYSGLTRLSAGQDSKPQVWSYEETGTALATIIAADYLIPSATGTDPQQLEAADLIYVTGSDGQQLVTVATVTSTTGITLKRFGGFNVLQATSTYNPASLADGVGETSSGITVTGAALGDFCSVAAPYDMQDILATCYVQATDTVEIRLQNEGAATVDLASGSWKVRVTKP